LAKLDRVIEEFAALRATIASARPVSVDARTYNPIAEKASDAIAARLRTVSALGVFG